MRVLLSAILLIIIYSAVHSIDPGYRTELIPERVVEEFYEDYIDDKPIVLKIDAGRFSLPLENLFKVRLFGEGYSLYETVTDESQVISIQYRTGHFEKTEKRLFSEIHIQRTLHNFYYQLTSYPQGEIVSVKELTIESEPIYRKTGLKWYDPLLMSAVVGGLVYLLYFGG